MQRRTEAVSAVQLSHILFKLPEHPTEQQLAEAKEKAAKAMDAGQGRRGFREGRQATSSEDDEHRGRPAASSAGSSAAACNPEWEPIVFAMDKGDVRGPVTGPQGLHVFFVTDVKKSELKPFDQMKEQLQRELQPPRDGQADPDLDRRAAQEGLHRYQAAVAPIR